MVVIFSDEDFGQVGGCSAAADRRRWRCRRYKAFLLVSIFSFLTGTFFFSLTISSFSFFDSFPPYSY
jgi:hypothetical protein